MSFAHPLGLISAGDGDLCDSERADEREFIPTDLPLPANNSHRIVTNFSVADNFLPDRIRVLPAAFGPLLVVTSVPGL
jgi:hypothetical protein